MTTICTIIEHTLVHEVLKHSNFPIDWNVEIKMDIAYFRDNFDMYVKQINFDLSIYYMRYFVENVYNAITDYKNKIDNLTNCIIIEDLERLTKQAYKVVFKNKNRVKFEYVLVKVCPKTVKWRYINECPRALLCLVYCAGRAQSCFLTIPRIPSALLTRLAPASCTLHPEFYTS